MAEETTSTTSTTSTVSTMSTGSTPADVSKAPARIAGMFDAIARRYDLLNHVLSAGIDRWWRRRAIQSLALTGRERLLDLCAGTGDVALAALRARPGARRAIGVDFAAAMLRVADDKVRRAGFADAITLVRGDATSVPLRSGTVDAVTVAFGVRNVENTRGAVLEIHRALAADGRFAILEFAVPTMPVLRTAYGWYFTRVLPRIGRAISKHDRAYAYLPASVGAFAAPAEFVTILRQAGFVDVRAVPLTLGIVCLYTGRKGPAAGD